MHFLCIIHIDWTWLDYCNLFHIGAKGVRALTAQHTAHDLRLRQKYGAIERPHIAAYYNYFWCCCLRFFHTLSICLLYYIRLNILSSLFVANAHFSYAQLFSLSLDASKEFELWAGCMMAACSFSIALRDLAFFGWNEMKTTGDKRANEMKNPKNQQQRKIYAKHKNYEWWLNEMRARDMNCTKWVSDVPQPCVDCWNMMWSAGFVCCTFICNGFVHDKSLLF